MLPNTTLRGWHFEQMQKALQVVQSIMQTHSQQDMTTFRDGGTGWTALETLCHLRDFEAIFLERARMSVTQDKPTLPNANPDELAAQRRYNEQNLADVYAEWSRQRGEFMAYLGGLSEADWAREGVHPRRGLMSVQDQLALTAWHDVNHIEQMTRILAEKKA